MCNVDAAAGQGLLTMQVNVVCRQNVMLVRNTRRSRKKWSRARGICGATRKLGSTSPIEFPMSKAKPISYSAAVAGSTQSNSKNHVREEHERPQISPKNPQQHSSHIKRSPITITSTSNSGRRRDKSRLESNIILLLKEVTAKTSPFAIKADRPFRLKKGFAVSVSSRIGGSQAKQIHQDLQEGWKKEDFLSEQDAGGFRLHYTLMNKVDDEVEISEAYNDLLDRWRPESGTAEGLALWRYDRGFWKWERNFSFEGNAASN
ncbi:hypothetical protein MRB53_041270 [Persea americana]|nr:hypothetical protein MRB53_041270 [Persea americana]